MEDHDDEISLDDGDDDGDDPMASRRGWHSRSAALQRSIPLGTKRLASLSTRICRVDRSGVRHRVPAVVGRATTGRAVVEDAEAQELAPKCVSL